MYIKYLTNLNLRKDHVKHSSFCKTSNYLTIKPHKQKLMNNYLAFNSLSTSWCYIKLTPQPFYKIKNQFNFFKSWVKDYLFKYFLPNIFKNIMYFFFKNYNFLTLKRWLNILLSFLTKIYVKNESIAFIRFNLRGKIGVTGNKRKSAIDWKRGVLNSKSTQPNTIQQKLIHLKTVTGSISMSIVIRYIR